MFERVILFSIECVFYLLNVFTLFTSLWWFQIRPSKTLKLNIRFECRTKNTLTSPLPLSHSFIHLLHSIGVYAHDEIMLTMTSDYGDFLTQLSAFSPKYLLNIASTLRFRCVANIHFSVPIMQHAVKTLHCLYLPFGLPPTITRVCWCVCLFVCCCSCFFWGWNGLKVKFWLQSWHTC